MKAQATFECGATLVPSRLPAHPLSRRTTSGLSCIAFAKRARTRIRVRLHAVVAHGPTAPEALPPSGLPEDILLANPTEHVPHVKSSGHHWLLTGGNSFATDAIIACARRLERRRIEVDESPASRPCGEPAPRLP